MKKNYKFWVISLIILVCIETITVILFDTFYCLDRNNNSICDKGEAVTEKSNITSRQEPEQETALNKSTALVSKVIDGDTIELQNGTRIRLTGIDAPEKGDQYYQESGDKLKELVEGKTVVLENDVVDKDSHCRLLRYVFVDDLFVNQQLVKEGYAITHFVKPNIKYENVLANAENEAEIEKLKIWKYRENLCNDTSNL